MPIFSPFLLIGCLAICLAGLVFLIGLSNYIVSRLIRPQTRAARSLDLEQLRTLPFERISFAPLAGEHLVTGVYIPREGSLSTIVLSSGYRRGLNDVLPMCRTFWEDGHQVLAFEYYGHGSSTGSPITLGHRELNDFLGAVEYVKQRDPLTRIGAIGYSMGAAITLMGAARTQDIEAVVADSAFASSWSPVVLAVHRAFRLKSGLPAWLLTLLYTITDLLLWLRAGYRFHQVEPLRTIKQIAPRPLLLIHGTNDVIVSSDDAAQLYEAANFPKYLWLISGARHMGGRLVERSTYSQYVTAFFTQSLTRTAKLKNLWQVPDHQFPFSSHKSIREKEPVLTQSLEV